MTVTISGVSAPALVSTVTASEQYKASITPLANGGYAVVWQDYGGRFGDLYLQQYSATGAKVGAETALFNISSYNMPTVAALTNGDLLVAWLAGGHIATQRITSSGALIGPVQTASNSVDFQSAPAVAALQGGGYVVSWSSDSQDGSDLGVYGQRFDAAGAKIGAEFRINATVAGTQTNSSISGTSDGGFVATWESPLSSSFGAPVGIYMQRYDASGATVGGETLVSTLAIAPGVMASQAEPSVTGLSSGFVVVWQGVSATYVPGTDQTEIYMQIYDASGATVGGQTRVNTTTASIQKFPAVTGMADGGFSVAWLSGTGGVATQRFSAAGQAVGVETFVTTAQVDFDGHPVIAGLTGGGYAVAWSGPDGSVTGTYQSVVFSSTGGVLTTSVETAIGDGADDIFYAAPGTLNVGDRLDGGAGADRIQLTSAGTTNLFGVSMNSVEKIVGSAGDDTIVFSGGAPSGVALDGGGGANTLVLSTDTDLAALNLTGAWRVTAAAGTGVTFKATSVDHLTLVDGAGATVTIDASAMALTAEQRAALFAQGADYVQQAGGLTFAAAGTAVKSGSAFAINPNAFAQTPSVAGLSDGRIVVVSYGGGPENGIAIQLFDRQGGSLGAAVTTTSPGPGATRPDVAALTGGGFVLTWQEFDSDGFGVKAQVFNASAQAVGSPLVVNTGATGLQISPEVTALAHGGFVIAWESQGALSGAQRFSSDGQRIGNQIDLSSRPYGSGVSVASLSNGGFVVVSQDSGTFPSPGLVAEIYDAAGVLVGGKISVHSAGRVGAVASLAGGGFVVTWSADQSGNTSGGKTISFQRFSDTGAKVGPETSVDAQADNGLFPAVAGTADGGFTITWWSMESAIGTAISTQRYDASGVRIGAEVVLPAAYADSPAITALAGGGSALVWEQGQSSSLQMLVNAALDYRILTAGSDTMSGGSGETLVVAAASHINAGDSVTGGAGADTFELSAAGVANLAAMAAFHGFETLLGSSGADTFVASTSNLAGLSALDGRGGGDTLQLSAPGVLNLSAVAVSGMETLLGSSGDDTFVLANAGVFTTIDGGSGADTLSFADSGVGQSHSLSATGGHLVSIENLTGSAFADALTGDSGANTLAGLGGDDTLDGGAGADRLMGGAGSDQLYGMGGNDTLIGGGGTAGAPDYLYGGAGNDTYYVASTLTSPLDLVFEGTLFAGSEAGVGDVDTIHSTDQFFWDFYSVAETLYIDNAVTDGAYLVGGKDVANKSFFGSSGTDLISTYGGNARVDAGAGVDAISFSLFGLAESYRGANTVVMKAGSGADYVYEFRSGTDKIDLTAFHFGINGQQVLDQAVNVDVAGTANDHCYFYLTSAGGVENYIVFMGLLSNQLQASDFIT